MEITTIPESAALPPLPPICLFGLDEAGKAHASRFAGADAERASKAAEIMGLHVLALWSPECDDLAEKLPQGKIFEKSGRAFVPYIARPVFERLASLGGIPVPPPAAKPEKAPKPAKAPKADTPAAAPKPSAKPEVMAAPAAAPSAKLEANNIALDWPHIRQGSLVLATTGGTAEGWFESVVVEQKDDDLMVLRWRDFEDALFLRRRNQLALLPEGTPLAAKA